MPATRPHLERERKRGEILDAAETLLLRDGYEATTMSTIARAVRVANNAVYWYFPSKDEVLAAVLRRRQERLLAEESPRSAGGIEEDVRALLRALDQVANLTAAVHERARRSSAVAEVHEEFHAAAEQLLRRGFREAGLSPHEAPRAAAALMAIIEGIHLHQPRRDPGKRDRLVLWTLERLLGRPSSGGA